VQDVINRCWFGLFDEILPDQKNRVDTAQNVDFSVGRYKVIDEERTILFAKLNGFVDQVIFNVEISFLAVARIFQGDEFEVCVVFDKLV
jgi:hypothetical protein